MNTEALVNTKPKRFIGVVILVAGAVLLGYDVWLGTLFHDPRVSDALRAGMLAAGATALGTLPILFSRRLSDRLLDTLLCFGAGVMLAATAFSLILPALNAAERLGASPWNAGLVVGAGILIGGLLLMVIAKVLPHEHFIKGAEG